MLTRWFLAGGLVLLATSALAHSALAQPPGRRGAGFGRRGFGPDGNQGSASALLRIPEVREELAVTDEQNGQIDEALAAMDEQMRGSFGNFQELQGLDEAERSKRFAAAREAAEAAQQKADAKLVGILKQSQRSRLEGLQVQREGARALIRPEIAERLHLSNEQREKLREIESNSRAAGPGGPSFQPMSDEERREFFVQMQKRRETADAAMLAVLTAEQRRKVDELKGEEFQFPQPQRGFGGGFGAGGGGFGPGGAAERKRPPIKKREQ